MCDTYGPYKGEQKTERSWDNIAGDGIKDADGEYYFRLYWGTKSDLQFYGVKASELIKFLVELEKKSLEEDIVLQKSGCEPLVGDPFYKVRCMWLGTDYGPFCRFQIAYTGIYIQDLFNDKFEGYAR